MKFQKIGRLVVVWCLLLLPPAAWAQTSDSATIAGVVRDTTGAVMPGVTVEAASPALIEKVRSVVTDAQGLYRIVDLRPGPYTLTFSLPGFSTFKREGMDLTSGFTATINAEMKVGSLEETVTVSGEAPVVDVQSIRQTTTVQRATLDALPTSGRIAALGGIIPGATLANAGTQSVGNLNERPQYGIHGGRAGDNAPSLDGINQRLQGGAIFVFNNLSFAEVAVETSGMSAERSTGGVQINMVPKDGGNVFSGTFKTSNTGPNLQADNLTDELQARGLKQLPGGVRKHYDVGGTLGGPIKRDKLWFFFGNREAVNQEFQQGNYFNKLAGINMSTDPVYKVTFYEPDLDRPAYGSDRYRDFSLRLTWQATTKHKIVASYENQSNCSCFYPLLESAGGTLPSPEATGQHTYNVNYLPLVTWTFPATNRLLFEAGASANVFNNHTKRQSEENVTTDIIGITDLATNYRYGSRATGLTHAGGYRVQHNRQYRQRFAASYVTGSHAFKSGIDLAEYGDGKLGAATDLTQIHGGRSYTFRNRVPQRVSIWAIPFEAVSTVTDISLYGQDQWTVKKLTMNLGVRYSKFTGHIPATHFPAGPFVPARDFPEVKNSPDYTNLSPRLGLAYDLFGNGKTAIRASLGRFTPYNIAAVDIPANNQASSTTRTWNDVNGNYVPDCNLLASAANGECGAWDDLTFGQIRAGNTHRAPDALSGFNNTPDTQWQLSTSLQQELRPNVALSVGYFRTWYDGFLATDNRLTQATDYDPFCITAPVDSRLPGGGGNQLCGLYDVKPALFGVNDNLVTLSENYGKQTDVFNGVDVTMNARFKQGGQFSGGLSLGRQSTSNCYTIGNPQLTFAGSGTNILAPRTDPFCNVIPSWASSTQVKFLFVYPLPWDLQASSIYQNIPGLPIRASRVFSNAEIAPLLGRNLAACRGAAVCTSTVEIDLIPPNSVYEERIQQVDLRLSRIFHFGKARVQLSGDLYNVFNVSNILNETTRYGTAWLNPISIMGGRLFKFTGQFDF